MVVAPVRNVVDWPVGLLYDIEPASNPLAGFFVIARMVNESEN